MVAGCGSSNTAATDTAKTSETVSSEKTEATETVESTEVDDQAAADHVAELIDAIYVQTRNDDTDAQSAEAKEALRRFDELSGNSLHQNDSNPEKSEKKTKRKGFMDKVKEAFEGED